MNFITYVAINLCQVILGVLIFAWIIMLMAFLGQGIIDISNHVYESGIIFAVALVITPGLFKVLCKAWYGLANQKRQLA